LSVIPECFYQESKLLKGKTFGFPIKDFGNDGGGFPMPLVPSLRGKKKYGNGKTNK
jgi:hypothetical protein